MCKLSIVVEYHRFERVKCAIESGKTKFFMFDRLHKFLLISLGFSFGFQICSLRLVYTYDAKHKPLVNLGDASTKERTRSFFCACHYACVFAVRVLAFNFPSLYLLDFSLELENEWKEICGTEEEATPLQCCRVPFTPSLVLVESLVCKKKEKSDLRGPAGPLVWRY